jgi:hypothetical protein
MRRRDGQAGRGHHRGAGLRAGALPGHPPRSAEICLRRVRRHHPGPGPGDANAARAGKPLLFHQKLQQSKVHPRAGGETRRGISRPTRPWGPSPRGRGNRTTAHEVISTFGSIPARAGKPTTQPQTAAAAWVHPRAGGETICPVIDHWLDRGPSPRGRGNLPAGPLLTMAAGSIPARAGKP